VNVLPGLGDGIFGSLIRHSANGYSHTGVATADLNGDGKLDAVTCDADAGTVSTLLGNGDGTLWFSGAFATGSSPAAVAIGDLNRDGRPDVAAINAGSNTASVLSNDGAWPANNLPSLRITDEGWSVEGNVGTINAGFNVALSAPSNQDVSVHYATSDGTATAGIDYQAVSGTLIIPAGQTSATIPVALYGDLLAERNEEFSIRLTDPTNAVIALDRGVGTIVDDEPWAYFAPGYFDIKEGNFGTTPVTFNITLATAYDQPVTVEYSSNDETATASIDYQAVSGTLIIPTGQTTATITVLVNGDRLGESDEMFDVGLSNGAVQTTIIHDDEPHIQISDVNKKEGKKNQTTLFTFTVTLSLAYDQAVTISFATVDGTAKTNDNDYTAKSGTLTFLPGETTKTITVEVKGDNKQEANETFYVDLFGSGSNLLFTKKRGIGMILNDD
jgi:hypothetical protein